MISIVTTAINRPAILEQTMETLFENSNMLEVECEWIVNIDKIDGIPNSEEAFRATVNLCRDYKKKLPVRVLPNRDPMGPGYAITRCRPHIKGNVVFFLEDDWKCHHERTQKTPLDVKEYIERLKEFSYCNCAGRKGRCSFNPSFFRASHFKIVTESFELGVDAERQAHRKWASRMKRDPKHWKFDPDVRIYFKDIGREWIKDMPLEKWNMDKRYIVPVTYNVKGKEKK